MGLKVSTTCELTFGENGVPAEGWLIGDVHDGIAQMFKVIEYARMMVGTKAIATLPHRLPQRARLRQAARPGRRPDPDDGQARPARHHHRPPGRAPQPDAAEVLRRGHARAGPPDRLLPGPDPHGLRRWDPRGGPRHGRAGQRPAAADRQGRRLGALLRAARDLAADPRRLRLPAGLPDRAVHPRRQDRHPLRGHHGDPGPGLLLPQDGPRPVQGRHVPRRPGGRVRQGRRGRLTRRTSASFSARRSRTRRP